MTETTELSGRAKFNRDRVYGEDLETRMLTALEWSFPDQLWQKHHNCTGTEWHCKCFDLEDLAYQRTIECKKDWTAQDTENLCFETYLVDPEKCRADYLAHEVAIGEMYWFKLDDLRRWLPAFGKPWMVGDGKRTEAWVLPKAHVLKNIPHMPVDLRKPLNSAIFG